jgi:MoxR-like ATPase
VDVSFSRIQFTSDLLPADVLGFSILRAEGEFEFRPGPIFGNIVLADELNRSTPRTQSALLEAMNERSISIDGETRELEEPFLVIATQNPLEFEGTYPLPESQLDRFLLRIRMGYPDREVERRVLRSRAQRDPIEDIACVISCEELRDAVLRVRDVRFNDTLMDYLLDLTSATRDSGKFLVGASPRASLGLMRAAQALALIEGREFCVPDDIKRLAVPVLAHRLVATHSTDNRASEETLVELLETVSIP